MKILSLMITTILAVIVAATSATAKDKNVIVTNTPGVTIENDSPIPVSMQPFCPCFSTEEIDATIGELTIVECNDDRTGTGSAPQNFAGTSMFAGPLALAGVSVGNTDNYRCNLVDENNNGIVSFDEIGFTNAMACRLAIINSSAWQRCPTTP